MKNTNNTGTAAKKFGAELMSLIKAKYPFYIVFILVFSALMAVSFFDIATSETVFSFALSGYQVNQISDRTIIAKKSLEPTELHPVAVQKGEEIIKNVAGIIRGSEKGSEKAGSFRPNTTVA